MPDYYSFHYDGSVPEYFYEDSVGAYHRKKLYNMWMRVRAYVYTLVASAIIGLSTSFVMMVQISNQPHFNSYMAQIARML